MVRIARYAAALLFIVAVSGAGELATRGVQPPHPARPEVAIPGATVRSEPFDPAGYLHDPEVVALFHDLFRLGGIGMRDWERAAFLVKRRDGRYDCILWPFTGSFRSESYAGRIPDGAVAILHTHPNQMTKASLQDKDTARAAGLPLFTITWANITVVDPQTGTERWVAKRTRWSDAVRANDRETCRCREIGTRDPREVGGLLASGK